MAGTVQASHVALETTDSIGACGVGRRRDPLASKLFGQSCLNSRGAFLHLLGALELFPTERMTCRWNNESYELCVVSSVGRRWGRCLGVSLQQ